MTTRSNAFTLVELLCAIVAIVIIALSVRLLLPRRGHPDHRQAYCGSKLNSISKGMALYQAEHEDAFPWARDTSVAVTLAAATARPTGGSDTIAGLSANMVENLNCLVKQASVSYKVFRCPDVASDIAEDRVAGTAGYNDVYGFMQRESKGGKLKFYNDYAYHIGYPNLDAEKDNPAPINDQMEGGFAIMADAAVRGQTILSKRWNHGIDGVNVLMASFSVSWVTPTVVRGGSQMVYHPLVGDDNVYGSGGPDATTVVRDAMATGPQDQSLHSPR